MPEFESWIEYRDVEEFPGYKVGNDGSVWSCRKPGRQGGFSSTWKRLMGSRGPAGHLTINLRTESRSYPRYIHRMVLEAFAGPCPSGMEACHNDGDPSNNHLGNLRWDTHRANLADMARHGTSAAGEKSNFAKLTSAKVLAIRSEWAEHKESICLKFGISRRTLERIISRKIWRHLGDITDPA